MIGIVNTFVQYMVDTSYTCGPHLQLLVTTSLALFSQNSKYNEVLQFQKTLQFAVCCLHTVFNDTDKLPKLHKHGYP